MIIGTCWYLSALLLLASLCASAITVVPGHESFQTMVIGGSTLSSILFVAAAIFLHTRRWRWIDESKLARNLFLGLAGLATLVLIPLIVG